MSSRVIKISGQNRAGAQLVYAIDIGGDGALDLYTEDGQPLLAGVPMIPDFVVTMTEAEAETVIELPLSDVVYAIPNLEGDLNIPSPLGGQLGRRYTFMVQQGATGGKNVTITGDNYGSWAPFTWKTFSYRHTGTELIPEYEAPTVAETSATIALPFLSASSAFSVTNISNVIVGLLTADLVMEVPTGAVVGQVVTYSFEQDNLGGRALTVHDVTMPLGLAGQVLSCQFQYRGGGKWAQMFGTIPWSGVPGAVGFGDSQSLNTWATPAIVTSTTTETVTINDGQEGTVQIIASATPDYTKTVAVKAGAAKSEVYADARLGFVRLNGNADAIRLGSSTPITLPQRHTVAVLMRMANSGVNGYSGRHLLLDSVQLGGSGQPRYSMGIAGSGFGGGNKASWIGIEFELNNNARGWSYSSGAEAGNNTVYNFFGTTPVKSDTDWFWALGVSSSGVDTGLVGNDIVISGSSSTYVNKILAGRMLHELKSTEGVAFRTQNTNSLYLSDTASFTASIASGSPSGTMTVTAVASGVLEVGANLSIGEDFFIFSQTGGTPGGVGTYLVRRATSGSVGTFASQAMTTGCLLASNWSNLEFIMRPGASSAAVMDVARVVFINDRLSRPELFALSQGAHPNVFGVPYQVFDFRSLPANAAVFAGAPTYITDATSPSGQILLGDNNASPVIANITNGGIS